ncbi:conserved hypothetical protein [Aspergillus terreus NIH2624]|uniref:Fermentation associated protein n=1 Tax=Aspergillus terreus (strain NIH 2624 / FGSC A1156) TaxID=341663 RepID=Q0CYA8_ASPTN|nr:uncharacterized protein ATEG_01326 [Aspergillus terreus NIH2624]EAU38083.1 conserved hypothetical protein [Aspergillus terreus NIH2624]
MASLSTLTLTPDPSFNWFFLLELIVSCILVLFFLLYFNRLFAALLSYAIRAYTWHYYRVYVDINALQISLLGGRIFFKGIRYHGVNETIFVHGGFITWRYWKRTVRKTDLSHLKASNGLSQDGAHHSTDGNGEAKSNGGDEQGGLKRTDALPCRITAKFYGLEWFVYNRTPAYDSILAGFTGPETATTFTRPQYPGSNELDPELKEGSRRTSSESRQTSDHASAVGNDAARRGTDGTSIRSLDPTGAGQEVGESLSRLLKLLPLKLECDKGAIVIGNEHTVSVLTTTFDSATGLIEACDAGPLDLYRQVFSFHLNHPIMQMRPNPDYKQNQLGAAMVLGSRKEEQPGTKRKRDTIFNYQFQKRRVWHSVRDLIPYFQTSVESFHVSEKNSDPLSRPQARQDTQWIGLSRYLDETSHDDHGEWNAIEYGRFSTILDSPGVDITYFWDIPGCVRPSQPPHDPSKQEKPSDINGAPPPEWGIDVTIEGGTVNYGPWADRERVGLQNVFFPNAYRSSQPAEPLAPGDLRKNSVFRLRVDISEELTLRIPIREPSKDWQWKGRANAIRGASRVKKQQGQQRRQSRTGDGDKSHIGPDIRPFGWLSLRVAGDSSISYSMDMVASASGFGSQLDIDLRESRMSSSVNHALLWQCPRQIINCDLSVPLSWNSLRTWIFDIESHDMELFLLRDHIFLLTDLVSDWASGPAPDYYTFVPFHYKLNLSFLDLSLFVNVNDQNIISNPSDLDDNRLLVIKGKKLTSDVLIPLDKYRTEQNAVSFNVSLRDGTIDFLSPLWDTLHTFLQDKSTATLAALNIDGSYDYYLSTSPDLTDTLFLNIHGQSPKLYLFGFLIRSFMTIKENYFGEDMHFKTLEEFQEIAYSHEPPDSHNGINPNRTSNDLDVIVHVTVDSPYALLPENIYDKLNCLRLTAPSLEADLRFTNYYMDLHFSIAPLKVGLEKQLSGDAPTVSDTQLFIDGVSIHGHRLFGLPPAEPTYVCNWDFDVGRIIGECSTEFLSCLGAGLKSFDFSFDNEENALPPLVPLALHDVTFLRAKLDIIHISVLLDKAAIVLSTGPVTTKFNDWANARFSKRMSLLVPEISVAAIDYKFVGRFGSLLETEVSPLALFRTTIDLRMVQRRSDIVEKRRLQQEHIKVHDQRTQRTPWLLFDWEEVEPQAMQVKSDKLALPTIAIPTMPEPIVRHAGIMGYPSSSSTSSLTESSQSSKSFLVSSDSSSVRGGRKRDISTVGRTKSTEEETASHLHIAEENQHNSPMERKHQSREPQNSVPDASNPWIMPNFTLHKISLDTAHLPSCPTLTRGLPPDSAQLTRFDPQFSPFDDDMTTYTNLALELPSGVRGFCTPEFLFTMSAFIEKLQPKHPVQIIDSLQKDVISDIVGYEKSLKQRNKATSIAIRAPFISARLVNSTEPAMNHEPGFCDEYSVEVTHLRAGMRTRIERQKGDLISGIRKTSTVHAAAESFSVSVEGTGTEAYHEKAEFSCLFGDLNFWLVASHAVRSNFQARAVDTVTFTKSVEHLASLVRRTTTMLDSVTSSFQHSSSLDHKRLRFLIYSLTKPAPNIADPVFLTRISYVLRLDPTHVRQHDSWKIISRIRNIYNHLSSAQKRELISKCVHDDLSIPKDARTIVLNSFDQWRAWDLAHVEKSYVMQKVWNGFGPKPEVARTDMFFSSTVKLLRFAIDPGPKETNFVVEDLSTAVSVAPEKAPKSEDSMRQRNSIIVESYCSSISLHLRWEILDLVEGVTRTMSTVTLESAPPPPTPDNKAEAEDDFQIIFGADLGSITLDGINVKLALTGRGLRSSVVQNMHRLDEPRGLSVLLSAQSCSSELTDFSRTLMLWRISDPHLYCSCVSEKNEMGLTNKWKMAGSSRKLRFDMKEDPLSLAHTADRLIEDEVRYIHRLASDLKLPTTEADQPVVPKMPVHNKFHVAMFLDDYRLSFCVLPSLTYVISGEVARTSIIPTVGSKVEVDFDLKKNLHTFSSNERDEWYPLSVLEIPPINGRVTANLSPGRTEMEVDVTIELIWLEASAVRSLIGALTKPEFSHLMSDLQQNVEILQQHLGDVLALDKSPPHQKESSSGHTILYKARMTMAGTKIHASAPALNGKNYSADMVFNLGMMRMRLDNGLENGTPMEYPEFHVDTSSVSFDLRKQEAATSLSYCNFGIDAKFQGTSMTREDGQTRRVYHFTSQKFEVELFSETAALMVDMAVHLRERIKTLDLSHEVKRFKRLRRRGHAESKDRLRGTSTMQAPDDSSQEDLFNAIYSFDFNNIQISWNMSSAPPPPSGRTPDDLVFSIKRVELSNRKPNAAKLRIEDVQLQMVPFSRSRRKRSLNSALLPELVFNVAYASSGDEVRLAFQAAGKSLDIRATSDFMLPASMIRDSIAASSQIIRDANAALVSKSPDDTKKQRVLFGNKHFRSVLVDVDFAGAVVSLQGRHTDDHQTMLTATLKGSRPSDAKYGQYVHGDTVATATLRAPGVAVKVQYEDNRQDDPALNAELKVDASTNVLYPSLVPLVKQMTSTVKEVLGDQEKPRRPSTTMMLQSQKLMPQSSLDKKDTDSILGRCKLNIGLLICKQEFSLSCQPIARVAATAKFDSAYVTVNTVSDDQGRFFALLVSFNSFQASVKHVYSNESTASFEVSSVVMSLINSKHLSQSKGISAALRVSPMQVVLNAKQVQDLLLFREIWVPSSDDVDSGPAFQPQSTEAQPYMVQRYQQVASAPAFPWNSAIAIERLEIQLDLGSTLGKAVFSIHDLWLSSKKSSDWEQTLCIGFRTAGIESKGRMSGLVELRALKVQTSIKWPDDTSNNKTPLIQASISFDQFQVKVSFDYQPFLIAHISMFDFLMYNVRNASGAERLFSILEGDQVQVFCTSLTGSQSIALYQAWKRLAQDKQAAYEASLREVERYLRRRTSVFDKTDVTVKDRASKDEDETEKAPISLHTGVVVTINSVNIGVFPSSFFDNHVFKIEANEAQARFDVTLDEGKIHSALGLTLGQLRVALSSIVRPHRMDIEELLVGEIANRVLGSTGGTILKVPRLVAGMETWQTPGSRQIDYLFRSTFEGKVDVGWNYSRISFIRDMWETHSRAMASRLGKPLPPSAVRITGGLNEGGGDKSEPQEKITAVVNVPQSKYTYVALEPPVIETPQLRDMGEATPPLEWIGLQRDKLPNVTHQIIIVTLLEIATEVEDAYAKILGSS